MDESIEQSKNEHTLQQIAKAQNRLDEIESKMKRFKSRKREEPVRTAAKAPYPDLNRYFTFLQEVQNNEAIQFTESQCLPKQDGFKSSIKKPYPYPSLDKQNDSLTINQKLEKEKKSSICKIEEYYIERNEILEEKIKELKEVKQKILKDQKLLLRNNEQLENQIEVRRQLKPESPQLSKLQLQVRKMRSKISDLEEQNVKMVSRKNQYQKLVNQNLKSHKKHLKQLQSRAKSVSHGRCDYH